MATPSQLPSDEVDRLLEDVIRSEGAVGDERSGRVRAKLLGELLVADGVVTAEQLAEGLARQQTASGLIGQTLVGLGHLSEGALLTVLERQLGVERVRCDGAAIDQQTLERVPAALALRYRVLPVRYVEGASIAEAMADGMAGGATAGVLTVAMSDPLDVRRLDELWLLLGVRVRGALAGEQEIVQAIRRHYGVGAGTVERLLERQGATGGDAETASVRCDEAAGAGDEASIVTFVNQLLAQAVEDRATDVHIEPSEEQLRVRFRIDGVLYDAQVPLSMKPLQPAIASRIKIMAGLNVAERRLPQDGRIRARLGGRDYDLRVSILPTPHGESLVIRVLAGYLRYSLEELGLSESGLVLVAEVITKPHGILFVTGPTGSGKTTTLYACLQRIDRRRHKVITLEDPIEYQLDDVTQVQVHPSIGLGFAEGLRAMLRHDPDIMMVGEVRDLETAEIAIRLALTGHMVLSTLHTNSALGAVARLLDMGIEPYLVASSVVALVAQRLVRLVCPVCRVAAEAPGVAVGRGCEACRMTGYRGRTAIYEVAVVDATMRELIARRTSLAELERAAVSRGMRTLREDGWGKVREGLTTPEEVLRVTQADASDET